ncbi:MAG TPA: DUF6265 family protein [Allosphingosinicella sp.]|jgi:hypothetical protein|nr:DUF6265 family protein [Allosphingosinicella sp.]
MRKFGLAAAAMLWLTGFTLTPGERPFWLSGHWLHEDKEKSAWTEESWLVRGDMMVGVGMSGSGEAVESYEYMRIARGKDGRMTFWGSPRGSAPVPFPMVSLSAAEVVFENPAHDYPTRISYRREDDVLIATVSGPNGSKAQSWRYRRVRDAGPRPGRRPARPAP